MASKNTNIQEGKVSKINSSDEFKAFLLAHNIGVGTVFQVNYSPSFFQLVNLTVDGKMLSLRKQEFNKIEWVKLK